MTTDERGANGAPSLTTGEEVQTSVAPEGTGYGVPVLPAYRDGCYLAVWCDHEQVWHWHGGCSGRCGTRELRQANRCSCPPGTGDGTRAPHCRCPESPYRPGEYDLREVGPLTDAVKAEHPELWPCPDCAYHTPGRQCACGNPVCPQCEVCAQHADRECSACWEAFGGPGYLHCEDHGIVRGHVHAKPNKCVDSEGDCGLAYLVESYWPTTEQVAGAHVHCPECWAITTLVRHRFNGATPGCRGCRDALTPGQLTRVKAHLDRLDQLGRDFETARKLTGVSA